MSETPANVATGEETAVAASVPGQENGEEESLTDTWQRWAHVYHDVLKAHMRPFKLLRKMRLCNDEDPKLEEIIEMDVGGQAILASEKMLAYLTDDTGLTPDEVTSRWSVFQGAIKEVHPYLQSVVSGKCDPQTATLQKKLLQFFMDEICEHVNPEHLLRCLVSKKLLGDEECETFTRINEQKGPNLANAFMVSHLHRSANPDWYKHFLEALYNNGYQALVRRIDDQEYEKLQLRYSYTTTEQPLTQVYGEAEDTNLDMDGNKEIQEQPANLSHETESGASSGAVEDNDHDVDLTYPKLVDGPLEPPYGVQETTTTSLNIIPTTDVDPTPSNNVAFNEDKSSPSKNILTDEGEDDSNAEVGEKADQGEDDEGETDVTLRDYQQELAGPALSGNNVIICAPTGSGKTHVALKIIQNHLSGGGGAVHKVVFLVNQVALAEQQYLQCVRYLKHLRCKKVTGNTGDTEKVPVRQLLQGADVLVVTAQILLDALDKKEIDDVAQFSLIVFDECHHTNHNHPFNCIMHHYMSFKYSDSDRPVKLPQVVGLTASVGVGKASRQEQARNHIVKLCAHLDASFICTVSKHVQQLANFSNDPTYVQFICQQREVDRFKDKVDNIMKTIEEKMEKSEYKRLACQDGTSDLEAKLVAPRTRGTISYGGWVSQLRKEVAKVRDPQARRFLESCRRMFEFYNTSLMINDACDTADALKYLCKQLEITYNSIGQRQVEIDVFLKEIFDKNRPFLEAMAAQQANTNPKLIKLENLLSEAFAREPESRAIIFVKTRDLASALREWMLRRPRLAPLRPGKMVGAGPSVESGGMTKNQQVDVMQYFRDGDHKVMVATSVAEEGLDIRKCNLVVRYEHVSNEIAMVQARGRARAENSTFVTLAGDDKGVQQKEEVNIIREMMMRDAIKELQPEMGKRDFLVKLRAIQVEEKSERDLDLSRRKGRAKRQGEVEFRCRKCDEYAFMSSDLRKIECMHHVVVDLGFLKRSIEKPHPEPKEFHSMTFRSKLYCRNCGQDWGVGILYKNTRFPVVKVDGFVLTDEFDRKDAPKKWKQTSFLVEDMGHDELDAYRRDAAAVGYTEDE